MNWLIQLYDQRTGSSERFPIPHSDLKACFRQKLQSVQQSNWDQQTENKLHRIMPVLAPIVPSSSNHCEQVIWTRLRLGHIRLTHRHLLLGEPPPYYPEIRIRDVNIPVVPYVSFLGVIFDRRLTFLPHILHLRKKCEKSLNLLKVLSNTSWGADRASLLRVYQYVVLSRMDYDCAIYGSACNSALKKPDPVHHMALRICSGAFRTLPVQSFYVNCNQIPLDLRQRKLSLAYYFKILSVPSHPLKNVYKSTSMKRLYDARPSNTRPFMDMMKLLITELDLPNVDIQQRNPLLFQPWNTPRCHYTNPFANYSKSTVTRVIFQRVFAYHRSQYSGFSAIYTDGSKRADYVGCGVVIEDNMLGYRLDPSCSVFSTEAVAIYRALQSIDFNIPRKYCIYTDSMSQGFRYSILLATESRRNNRQRASEQCGKVRDDPSAASSSAIGYEARHPASYFYDLAGIISQNWLLRPKTPNSLTLLPSTSSVTVTSSSESQLPIPLLDTAPATSNSQCTSVASSSSNKALSSTTGPMFSSLPAETSPVLETSATSNTIPSTS
ncbi:putative RNA-directed DNA polymerase from transposon X-element [Trichonephila clavipes]|nr:putative RNA-directed DNA polymerase from transposon X-element [Trichonephila clavipes]